MSKIVVKRDEVEPEPVEVMARAIIQISEAMKRIAATRLTQRCIIALIHDNTGIARNIIKTVLENLAGLEKDWLKPETI